ncbi:MAG: hypothetical protein Q9227_000157 [Pyrenula ochraceoflavens]
MPRIRIRLWMRSDRSEAVLNQRSVFENLEDCREEWEADDRVENLKESRNALSTFLPSSQVQDPDLLISKGWHGFQELYGRRSNMRSRGIKQGDHREMQPLSDITTQAKNNSFKLSLNSKRNSYRSISEKEDLSESTAAAAKPHYMTSTAASEAQGRSLRSRSSVFTLADSTHGRRREWMMNAMRRVTPHPKKLKNTFKKEIKSTHELTVPASRRQSSEISPHYSPIPPIARLDRAVSDLNRSDKTDEGKYNSATETPRSIDKPLPNLPTLTPTSSTPSFGRFLIDSAENPIWRPASAQASKPDWLANSPQMRDDSRFNPDTASAVTEHSDAPKDVKIDTKLDTSNTSSGSSKNDDMSPGAAAVEKFLQDTSSTAPEAPRQTRTSSLRARLSAANMHGKSDEGSFRSSSRSRLPNVHRLAPRRTLPSIRDARVSPPISNAKGSTLPRRSRSASKSLERRKLDSDAADNLTSSDESQKLSRGAGAQEDQPETEASHQRVRGASQPSNHAGASQNHSTSSMTTTKRSSMPLLSQSKIPLSTNRKSDSLHSYQGSKSSNAGKKSSIPTESKDVGRDSNNVEKNEEPAAQTANTMNNTAERSIDAGERLIPAGNDLTAQPASKESCAITSRHAYGGSKYRVKRLSLGDPEHGPTLKISDSADDIILGSGSANHGDSIPKSGLRCISVPQIGRSMGLKELRHSLDAPLLARTRLPRNFTNNTLGKLQSLDTATNKDEILRILDAKVASTSDGPDDPFIETRKTRSLSAAQTNRMNETTASDCSEDDSSWILPRRHSGLTDLSPGKDKLLSPVIEHSPNVGNITGEQPKSGRRDSTSPDYEESPLVIPRYGLETQLTSSSRASLSRTQSIATNITDEQSIKSRRFRDMLRRGKEIISMSNQPYSRNGSFSASPPALQSESESQILSNARLLQGRLFIASDKHDNPAESQKLRASANELGESINLAEGAIGLLKHAVRMVEDTVQAVARKSERLQDF